MPISCHFQGCKALLRTVKRRYIKYHAFLFLSFGVMLLLSQKNDAIKMLPSAVSEFKLGVVSG